MGQVTPATRASIDIAALLRAAAPAWADALPRALLDGPDLRMLGQRLAAAMAAGERVLPRQEQWFAALAATPPASVRCVIVGQDPYPTPGHAHGLAFSVEPGVTPPRSLRNIYRELESDCGIPAASRGTLTGWANAGVLLLNSALTVTAGAARAHRGWGWEGLTDAIIAHCGGASAPPTAFLLWGADAQAKAPLINAARHCILMAPHPSPLSAHRGFFGSQPFSRANAWLAAQGRGAIDWRLPQNRTDCMADQRDLFGG